MKPLTQVHHSSDLLRDLTEAKSWIAPEAEVAKSKLCPLKAMARLWSGAGITMYEAVNVLGIAAEDLVNNPLVFGHGTRSPVKIRNHSRFKRYIRGCHPDKVELLEAARAVLELEKQNNPMITVPQNASYMVHPLDGGPRRWVSYYELVEGHKNGLW